MVFEDLGFDAFFRASGESMLCEFAKDYFQDEGIDEECQLILDSGFSFTYAVPIFGGLPMSHAATRIDIGGKLLTNLLNEIISYKEYNLTGETLLVNDIKEQLCYVSTEFDTDLKKCHEKEPEILKEYVLPDYNQTTKGYSRDFNPENRGSEQVITMGNPRFTVPEVLFNPNDIGIHQAGIPEMVSQCIEKCPDAMQRLLYRNIVSLLLTFNKC
jgi:actin-related protein 6